MGYTEQGWFTRLSKDTGNRIEIHFGSKDDMFYFLKYMELSKAEYGTIKGVWAGLMCSAMRHATIHNPETGVEIPTTESRKQ